MPVALLANPSFPAKTVADFIAMAKKDPGKLNLGTSAVGTGGYMCAELFKAEAGVDVAHHSLQGHRAGDERPARRARADGVRRAAAGARQYPGRQAARDRGDQQEALFAAARCADIRRVRACPASKAVLHYGLLAPAGTPKEIVDRLSAELRKLVDSTEVQKRIHAEGGDPLTSTPAEYAADIDKEEKKWGGLVKKLGLKVE